ncbi:MAG TPA: hypothetical protein VGF84_06080 [Micromonosporaceae bacterium]|jgi:hypothetical protein
MRIAAPRHEPPAVGPDGIDDQPAHRAAPPPPRHHATTVFDVAGIIHQPANAAS